MDKQEREAQNKEWLALWFILSDDDKHELMELAKWKRNRKRSKRGKVKTSNRRKGGK